MILPVYRTGGSRAMELQNRERVISISLPESDWKAFLEIQPQPVNWLKARIDEMLREAKRGHQAATPRA